MPTKYAVAVFAGAVLAIHAGLDSAQAGGLSGRAAAGVYHSAAVLDDGTLWTWGGDYSGQLGNGPLEQRECIPASVDDDTDWIFTAAGAFSTYALKSDGSLWAWGENAQGDLGDGTTIQRDTPTRIGADTDWTFVTCGAHHVIALKSDGSMWAWGNNSYGQLGIGTFDTSVSSPVQVGGDTDWAIAAAGNYHTIALKIDGSLWAWGRNAFGQVGDGTTTDRCSPVRIGSEQGWTDIAGGVEVSFGIKDDNRLWGWGQNASFQLGLGSRSDREVTPVQVGTDVDWVEVSAARGSTFALARKIDGSLWGWCGCFLGNGGGVGGGCRLEMSPVRVGNDSDWASINVGFHHTIALKVDGTAWAWGDNRNGQVGNGTTGFYQSLIPIGNDADWVSVAAGGHASFAMKENGSLWAWGNGWYGNLGTDDGSLWFYPTQVGLSTDWQKVAPSFTHTLALKHDGSLWACGRAPHGLGQRVFTRIGSDTDWTDVAAGWVHNVALKADGTLWVWGYDLAGTFDILGPYAEPTLSPVQVGSDSDWTAIAAGNGYNGYTLMLKSDGSRWGWGANELGQLGDGSTLTRLSPVRTGTDTDWASISAGYNHSVGLKMDGSMWVWGSPCYYTQRVRVPTRMGTDTDWVDVVTGNQLSLAAKTDGSLWRWGSSGFGGCQLVQLGTDLGWVDEAAGNAHLIVLRNDGTIWAWGSNEYGQLGIGLTYQVVFPSQISFYPNEPPVADAGSDQAVHPGTNVTLDGSGSCDPDEDYPLSYSWQLIVAPPGSSAELAGSDTVNPSVIPDLMGDYTAQLVVTDSQGCESEPDAVMISTYNTAPVAAAGPDQALLFLHETVVLDGSQSYDDEGDAFAMHWEFHQIPCASAAVLSGCDTDAPTFVADVYGEYVVRLNVVDVFGAIGEPDEVTVSFANIAPVAHAGGNQAGFVGQAIVLDGSESADANNDPLAYTWSFVSVPENSQAALTGDTEMHAVFAPDLPGTYVITLVVNDGLLNSAADNVTVEVITRQDAIGDILLQLIERINQLPPTSFKNENLRHALTAKLNAALGMLEHGAYATVFNKLERDLLPKTDGCAFEGVPDVNDWLIDCDSQEQVCPLVLEAMGLLLVLM